MTLLQILQYNGRFLWLANAAPQGVVYNDGFVLPRLILEYFENEGHFLRVIAADSPAAKTTGSMGGPVTMPAFHKKSSSLKLINTREHKSAPLYYTYI